MNAFQDMFMTNIYTALKVALRLVELEEAANKARSLQPIIIFLTDGEPTAGVTDIPTIIQDVGFLNFSKGIQKSTIAIPTFC